MNNITENLTYIELIFKNKEDFKIPRKYVKGIYIDKIKPGLEMQRNHVVRPIAKCKTIAVSFFYEEINELKTLVYMPTFRDYVAPRARGLGDRIEKKRILSQLSYTMIMVIAFI